jgi:hypothetical protein
MKVHFHLKNKICFILCSYLALNQANAYIINKDFGLGIEVLHNFPLVERGFGARIHYHHHEHWIFSPQLLYVPPLKKIHELNIVAQVSYILNPNSRWVTYATCGTHLNLWFNHAQSPMENAKLTNIGADIGIGIMKNYNCIRPFVEYRHNVRWNEANMRLGFIFLMNDCKPKKVCESYI